MEIDPADTKPGPGKTVRKIVWPAIALLAIAFLFDRYWHLLRPGISDALASATAPAGATVDLRQIATFEWDRVALLGPYTTPEKAEALLGFPLQESWFNDGIEHSDGFSLIVFAKGNHATLTEHTRRCSPDFGRSVTAHVFKRDEAVFRSEKHADCTVIDR